MRLKLMPFVTIPLFPPLFLAFWTCFGAARRPQRAQSPGVCRPAWAGWSFRYAQVAPAGRPLPYRI